MKIENIIISTISPIIIPNTMFKPSTEFLLLSCASVIICAPTLLNYTKKLKKYFTNTYQIELDQNSNIAQINAIKNHIITKHNIQHIILKNNIPQIEATITETHDNIKFTIEITHTSLLVTLSSKHHTPLQLSQTYEHWLHDKIKKYDHSLKDYIVIGKDFMDLDTFMVKYIYIVAPNFKSLNILTQRSHISKDIPLLYKSQEYGIIDDPPYTNTAVHSYGKIRFVETFNDIDIFIEIYDSAIWLYYVDNAKSQNTKQIIMNRILTLLSVKNEIYIINTHDVDSKNKQLINKNTSIFLQPDPAKQHDLIMRRINKMKTQDSAPGFGIFLHGPPGNGKSTYSRYLATACDSRKDIHLINLSRVNTADELFQTIYNMASTQSIILMEDLDRAWNTKIINIDDKFDSEAIDKKIGLDAFLSAIDMAISCGLIVMITANSIVFDEAVIRNGRFDYVINMKNCDCVQLNQIVDHFFESRSVDEVVKKYRDTFVEYENSVATVYSCVQNMFLCS